MSIKTFLLDFRAYNTNIQLALTSGFLVSMGRGIILGSVFSVFAKELGGSNQALGAVTTFNGIIMTLTLFPTGFLSDKYPRRYFLRIGSVLAVLGFVFLLLAEDIGLIFVAQGVLGLSRGLNRPSLESMIADSVASKRRDRIYSQIFFLRQTANSAGPLLAAILFVALGDSWGVETMRQVMLFGAVFTSFGAILQIMMHDKYYLGEESESIQQNYPQNATDKNSNREVEGTVLKQVRMSDNWWFVPAALIILGFMIGLGAGMTVRYFPIFFKEIYLLPPSTVNLIFAFAMVLTGGMSLMTPVIASRIGKLETVFAVQGVAIIFLLIIALIPPLAIVVPIFVLRNSFMNSSQPIQRSILMDRVPKKSRGKWNALQVLSFGFLWSLSAGAGGVLLDMFDFSTLYVVTALFYVAGTVPLLFFRRYVRERPHKWGKPKETLN